MRKIIILLSISLISSIIAVGQGPVKWNFTSKKIADRTYEIHIRASINEPWHIYSQGTPPGGPLPTTIKFSKNPLIILNGKVKENGELEIYHDEIFDVDVFSYTGTVDFVQVVKLKANAKTNVSGTVEFMACTREQCLTPEKLKFSVRLE